MIRIMQEATFGVAGAEADQLEIPETAYLQLIELLSKRSLFKLREYFRYCHLSVGSDFHWQKEERDQLGAGVLLSGKLAAMKQEGSVKTVYSKEIFGPGMLVGDDGFIYQFREGCSVTALEESELLLMSRVAFNRLEQQHPELGGLVLKWLLTLLTDRLIWAQVEPSDSTMKDVNNVQS